MQRKFGFILSVNFVYVFGAMAGNILAPHPGFFKIAIGRQVNDDISLFDPTEAQLEAQDLRTSHKAISPRVVARADDLPSTVAPAGASTSGTARLNMQEETVAEPVLGDATFDYGSIRFGTPPQELLLNVDTAIVDTWVISDCKTCSRKLKLFNKTASTSFVDKGVNFTVPLMSRNMNATLSEDVVSVAGLSVQEQTFGVTSESPTNTATIAIGVLGLGFGSLSSLGKKTFVRNLIDEKRLAQPIVSVHVARPGQKIRSEACFGCLDDTKTTHSASWVPLISNQSTKWEVPLTGLCVNNKMTGRLANVSAVISTITRPIVLPQDLTERVYDMIPGSQPATEYGTGYYKYPCNSSISISITLGVSDFPLNATDFNLGQIASKSDQNYCIGGIRYRVGDEPNFADIGHTFLRSWYSTFNYENASIGFSPSINNKYT